MKDYQYSLYDSKGNVLSPENFSKARFFSIWYGETLKVELEVFPTIFKRASEKKEFIVEFIWDYLDQIRLERLEKARQTRAKKSKKPSKKKPTKKKPTKKKPTKKKPSKKKPTKRPTKEGPREKIVEEVGPGPKPETTLKKARKKLGPKDVEVNIYKKQLLPKYPDEYGKFEVTKINLKFKKMPTIDPTNKKELDDVLNRLREMFKTYMPEIIQRAKKDSFNHPVMRQNSFIVRIVIPKIAENNKIMVDKLVARYDLSEWYKAEKKAREVGGEIIKRKKKLEVVIPKELIKDEKTIKKGTMLSENAFDSAAGIGMARSLIDNMEAADYFFEGLLKKFEGRANDYVARQYAPKGTIGGLDIEYVSKVNIK